MVTNTKKNIIKIPKLRFTGFSSAWELKKLGDVSQYSKDKIPTLKLNEYNFVGVDNLLPNLGGKLGSRYLPLKGNVSKYKIGDILHSNIRPYLKKAWQADNEGGSSADVLIIRPNNINHKFLFYQITSDSYFEYVMSGSKGVKMPRGDKEHIMKYEIVSPSLEEQQKIAEFLELNDKWIENLKAQKEILESYKKGMMQELFSQDIKFKDDNGKGFPKWEEKELKDIAVFSTAPYFEVDNNCKDGFYLVDMGAVSSDGQLLVKKQTSNKSSLLSVGDLVMPNRDIGHGEIIGKVSLIDLDNKYVLGSNMYKLSVNRDLPTFVFYLINSEKVNAEMRKRSNGTSQLQLIRKDVETVEINIPSLPEQQKIADFLTSLDKVIQSKQQQITQAKLWKKGLMQELFV